jgi:hypothetical protein
MKWWRCSRFSRLEHLRLGEAAEEAQRDAADALVGVLQVVAEVLADEDHLRQDAAGGVALVDDLEVEEQQLLDGEVLGREDVADDGDEERAQGLAVEDEHDGALHGLDLGGDVAALQIRLDLIGHGGGALVEVDQQSAWLVHGGGSSVHPHRRAPAGGGGGWICGGGGSGPEISHLEGVSSLPPRRSRWVTREANQT